jgi:hypothetical protein
VKGLSGQTAKATDEIRSQVNAVRAIVGDIASAMNDISGMVARISEATDGIAAAVEEQAQSPWKSTAPSPAPQRARGRLPRGRAHVRGVARRSRRSAAASSAGSQALIERSDLLMAKVRGFIERIRLADRRAGSRDKVTHSVALIAGAVGVPGTLASVSAGGAGILTDAAQLPAEATDVILEITGVPFDATAPDRGRDANRINTPSRTPAEGRNCIAGSSLRHARQAA